MSAGRSEWTIACVLPISALVRVGAEVVALGLREVPLATIPSPFMLDRTRASVAAAIIGMGAARDGASRIDVIACAASGCVMVTARVSAGAHPRGSVRRQAEPGLSPD